jgi:uncharacterized cupredoxin-like copper-binding protein
MFRSRFMAAAVVPVAILATAVTGCGSSNSGSSTTQASTSTKSKPATAGGGSTVKVSADPSGALKFTQSSLSGKAGKVTLQMSDPSSSGLQHGISVEGNGVDQTGTIVQPGGTATVSATLKPGKYTFYCPFDSHKAQGMTGTLTVK